MNGGDQLLVTWAEPIFKDPNRCSELADPLVEGNFPRKSLNQAAGVAAMCLHEDPSTRPLTSDVVTSLSYLWVLPDEEVVSPVASIGTTNEMDMDDEQDKLDAQERQEALAEAIQWGSTNSRTVD
ncbi:hypothetical protein Leryth_003299 [Lithospermum erythrorhizon]|nr:hypothetical protein Leryth_003299 [Lithospermum erythrorhizon]